MQAYLRLMGFSYGLESLLAVSHGESQYTV